MSENAANTSVNSTEIIALLKTQNDQQANLLQQMATKHDAEMAAITAKFNALIELHTQTTKTNSTESKRSDSIDSNNSDLSLFQPRSINTNAGVFKPVHISTAPKLPLAPNGALFKRFRIEFENTLHSHALISTLTNDINAISAALYASNPGSNVANCWHLSSSNL